MSRFFPQMQPFEPSLLKLPDRVQVSKIATGLGNVILLDSSGVMWVLGDNKRGQLGLPLVHKEIRHFTPIEMEDPVNEVQTGLNFTLALTSQLTRKG